MIRNKVLLSLVFVFCIPLINSCSNSSEPSEIDYGWVAVQANFYEQDSRHIYLVNYNNPSKYKQITFGVHSNYEVPRFSPDRKSLIYGDTFLGNTHNPGLVHYDLTEAIHDTLFEDGQNPTITVKGTVSTWDPSGNQFYLSKWYSFGVSSIRCYNIDDSLLTSLVHLDTYGPNLIGFLNSETMIVWSADESKGARGYYYMDLNGEYQSRINNPFLEHINIDGVDKKAPYFLTYNMQQQLFAFAQVDSSTPGFEIAVTNLDGSYYEKFTSGYMDSYPCWGPGDDIILFDRAEIGDNSRRFTTTMKLNIENGNVTEFVSPSSLDGATGLSHPNY